jgi:hypothetical protein
LLEGAGDNIVAKNKFLEEETSAAFFPVYKNTDFHRLQAVSPILVNLSNRDNFLHWLMEIGLKQNQGIIILTDASFAVVLRYIQARIEMKMPKYNFAIFRFHDATVLDRYLLGTSRVKQEEFIGPLSTVVWSKRLLESANPVQWSWQWRCAASSYKYQEDESAMLLPSQLLEITSEELQNMDWERYSELADRLLLLVDAFNCTTLASFRIKNSPLPPWDAGDRLSTEDSPRIAIASYLQHYFERYNFHSEDELMHTWNIMQSLKYSCHDNVEAIDKILFDRNIFTTQRISMAYQSMNEDVIGGKQAVMLRAKAIMNISTNQKSVKENAYRSYTLEQIY